MRYEQEISALKAQLDQQQYKHELDKKNIIKTFENVRTSLDVKDTTAKKNSVTHSQISHHVLASQESPKHCTSFHIPNEQKNPGLALKHAAHNLKSKSISQMSHLQLPSANNSSRTDTDTLPISLEEFNLIKKRKGQCSSSCSMYNEQNPNESLFANKEHDQSLNRLGFETLGCTQTQMQHKASFSQLNKILSIAEKPDPALQKSVDEIIYETSQEQKRDTENVSVVLKITTLVLLQEHQPHDHPECVLLPQQARRQAQQL